MKLISAFALSIAALTLSTSVAHADHSYRWSERDTSYRWRDSDTYRWRDSDTYRWRDSDTYRWREDARYRRGTDRWMGSDTTMRHRRDRRFRSPGHEHALLPEQAGAHRRARWLIAEHDWNRDGTIDWRREGRNLEHLRWADADRDGLVDGRELARYLRLKQGSGIWRLWTGA